MPIDPTLDTTNFPESNEGVNTQPSDESSIDPNEIPHVTLIVMMEHVEVTGDGFEHNRFFKSAIGVAPEFGDPQEYVIEQMKSFLYLNENGDIQVAKGYDYAVFLAQIDNQVLEFKPGNIVIFYSNGTKGLLLGNTSLFSNILGADFNSNKEN